MRTGHEAMRPGGLWLAALLLVGALMIATGWAVRHLPPQIFQDAHEG